MTANQATNDWRTWLRWKIFWLLAFKLAALTVLWLLFFAPSHRVAVDPGSMSERLAPAERDADVQPPTRSIKDAADDV